MMVDTVIRAYRDGDGDAFHPLCWEAYYPRTDPSNAWAIFSHDDGDPHGLRCYQCQEWIFDPVPVHHFERGAYGNCVECGEAQDDDQLHFQPEHRDLPIPPGVIWRMA